MPASFDDLLCSSVEIVRCERALSRSSGPDRLSRVLQASARFFSRRPELVCTRPGKSAYQRSARLARCQMADPPRVFIRSCQTCILSAEYHVNPLILTNTHMHRCM